MRSPHRVVLLSGTLALSACVGRGDAAVLVDLVDAAALRGLVGVRARLTLTDATGEHPAVTVQIEGGESTGVVGVDVPIPCADGACAANLSVDPGAYEAVLTLSALDRCRVRGDVLAFSGAFEVAHWGNTTAVLTPSDASFDADADGVIDALEASGCGRFDLDEGLAAARACGPGREACCPEASPHIGGMQAFAGGVITLPYDRDGAPGDDVVSVAAFALDSTELTYGALARCVAAGACLAGAAGHPARLAIDGGVNPRLPVQGLSPSEASAVCGYYGRRLPRDAEWHFAAADRAGGQPGLYPFDVEAGVAIGCTPDDPPPAARHRASGRACGDGAPLPVGSFLTTLIERGTGNPIVDLAGNVAEWTVLGDPSLTDRDEDGRPDDAAAIGLRGGGAGSFVQLLENELAIVFDTIDDVDVTRLAAAAAVAGVRCASDVALVRTQEQACPAPEPNDGVDADGPVAPNGDGDGSSGEPTSP